MRHLTHFANVSLFTLLAFGSLPGTASATLVGGSGAFTLPANTGPLASVPGVVATYANVGPNHTGTWAAPANSAWWGTFNGTGPITGGALAGSSQLTFGGLNSGFLPSGSYVWLGDLDSGESLTLLGYDTSGNVIQSHWLTDLEFVGGANPADFVTGFMPTWTFNNATNNGTGLYTLTGEQVSGNPVLLYVLRTTEDLSRIDLSKSASFNFSLAAPQVPEPGSLILMGLGLTGAGLLRRRQRARL